MKKLLFTAAVLTALSTQAQYFQSTYSTGADFHQLTSGVNTRIIGDGHLMGGAYRSPGAGVFAPMVVKTDADGRFTTANDFGIVYDIYSNVTGSRLDVSNCEALEVDPTITVSGVTQYIYVGHCTDPSFTVPQHYLYIGELDGGGNVVPNSGALFSVPTATGGTYPLKFLNAKLSNSGKEVYLTGLAQDPATPGNVYAYALKLSLGTSPASIVWSNVFSVIRTTTGNNVTFGFDIIESPYANEVLVVGESYEATTGSDAFVQKLNSNTGALIGTASIFGGTGFTYEVFTSIEVMNNNGIVGTPGFVMGGISEYNNGAGGGTNQYICFIDDLLTAWVDLEIYYNNGDQHVSWQARERLDVNGDYSYFLTGRYTDASNNSDMLTHRYNSNTGVVSTFLYGTTDQEEGYCVDYYNTGAPAEGLASYGIASGNLAAGNTDFYLVKSYFSGESGCNENITTGGTFTGPGLLTTVNPSIVNRFRPRLMKATTYTSVTDNQHCYATSIPGGSNNMNGKLPTPGAPDNQVGDISNLSVSASNTQEPGAPIDLTVISQVREYKASIRVYDMLGRSFELGNYVISAGANHLQIPVGDKLNKGMYLLEITTEAGVKATTHLYIR